ncbi:BolA protein [Rhodovulum imhoffii]|uniref:BolA protein n=1 Tax=Rhodovulum imhoffii TaxID=365340 RepID=A0A2T5BQV0_9RHOB|nr:BolA family protein [Rhodovulum imhoffii]MBK5933860.1 BolA family transcriptional regulator [Rhodovulum imhoffii]PTN01552.1 BolA protein [Rhodovulum imhoffii]
MSITREIHERLEAAFAPTRLDVVDDSERHRGHAGYREGGESHFRVAITAPAFAGMSRLERHRAIHAALGEDVIGQIHALALSVEA